MASHARLHCPARRALLRAALPAAAVLALAACASADTTFYTLNEVPGTPDTVLSPTALHVVELRRPGLPGYLDRTDIVRRDVGYRLDLAKFESWAEPISDMTGRVLAADLSQRLPGMSIFSEAGAISAEPDARVDVDIQRFSAGADGVVRLNAQIAIERGASHLNAGTRRVSVAVTPGGPTTSALVAAMSVALGQLSDEIAVLLRTAGSTS